MRRTDGKWIGSSRRGRRRVAEERAERKAAESQPAIPQKMAPRLLFAYVPKTESKSCVSFRRQHFVEVQQQIRDNGPGGHLR